jgi:hypothetical protein
VGEKHELFGRFSRFRVNERKNPAPLVTSYFSGQESYVLENRDGRGKYLFILLL